MAMGRLLLMNALMMFGMERRKKRRAVEEVKQSVIDALDRKSVV